jgi:hypothetical protein
LVLFLFGDVQLIAQSASAKNDHHSGMRLLAQASDAQLRIGESILIIVVIDSGLALRAPRNDGGEIQRNAV